MYEYFELGWCDRASLRPHQITKEARQLLKQAYQSVYGIPGQMPQEVQAPSRMPSLGTMAGLALLAGGGAYAHGRLANGSPLAGFADGVDSSIINPIKGFFGKMTSSPEGEYDAMSQRVNDATVAGQFDHIKNLSQLHGTDWHTPGGLENAANNATLAGTGVMAGTGGLWAGKKLMQRFTPNAATSFAGTGVGKTLAGGLRLGAKAMTPIAAISSIPDTLQLGDKASDAMGLQNGLARGAVKTTAVGAGIGGAVGGAKWGANLGSRFLGARGAAIGGALGGLAGGLAPGLLNGVMNYKNQAEMTMNANRANTTAMGNEFANALKAKNMGNTNPMQAWYAMAGDGKQFDGLVSQFKKSPGLQREMLLNRPGRPL